MATKKRKGPTREQFTDEEWERFGKLCQLILKFNRRRLLGSQPTER